MARAISSGLLSQTNISGLLNVVRSSSVKEVFQLEGLDKENQAKRLGRLRSLISPSVAKSLVKLKTLRIGGSNMMEEVVAKEGGEATDEITFYKLQHMGFDICQPHKLQFRWLYILIPILGADAGGRMPKMKMFSPSLVTTPRLKGIKVGDDEWPCRMI
ncbi:hypothetical protein CK203_110788 [Vitis vinifera]|uniref:Uncharacterized protein n=1 Tax=Vitis vinifera TaxID=29760 RepID=A0A438FE49_VITVI|nr:hypothetical protein CK203_110788 [Vitis vinifera]